MVNEYHAIEERKPKLGCFHKLEKFFVWIINFVLFVVGIAQIAAGIWAWKSGHASDWTGTGVPKACIAMGIFLVFISFLGCCGAWKENRPMLWFYALLLFLLVLGQVGALSVAAVSKDYTMRFMQEVWDHMDTPTKDAIEEAYECCSFMGSPEHDQDSSQKDRDDYTACIGKHPTYTEACYDQAHKDVEHNLKTVLIAVAIVGGVQVIILFATMCLINGISAKKAAKKEQRENGNYVSSSGHYPNI